MELEETQTGAPGCGRGGGREHGPPQRISSKAHVSTPPSSGLLLMGSDRPPHPQRFAEQAGRQGCRETGEHSLNPHKTGMAGPGLREGEGAEAHTSFLLTAWEPQEAPTCLHVPGMGGRRLWGSGRNGQGMPAEGSPGSARLALLLLLLPLLSGSSVSPCPLQLCRIPTASFLAHTCPAPRPSAGETWHSWSPPPKPSDLSGDGCSSRPAFTPTHSEHHLLHDWPTHLV